MADGVREAVAADLPCILEMGRRSLEVGPYAGIIAFNQEAASKTARYIMDPANGRILLYERDGETVGLLGFITYSHYFTGELTGQEIMWWVEPEHRKSMAAVALLRAAERIARKLGLKRMQFTAPTKEVGKMYEILGYRQLEVGYQKEL